MKFRPTNLIQRMPIKQLLALFFAAIVTASVARADGLPADAKAYLSTDDKSDPTTVFAPDTANICAYFKAPGAKGDAYHAVLIAEDVGTVAPPNTKILQVDMDVDATKPFGDATYSKPNAGWPVGKYRFELYLNSDLVTTIKFTVEAAKSDQ